MRLREGLQIGARNHLFIGGCDCVELAKAFGTPLYVLDEVFLRARCREFADAMKAFAPNGRVYYASKAFSCKAMVEIIRQEGLCLDVCSQGELHTALAVGFPMNRVAYHGNAKTAFELSMAVDNNVGHIVIDNRDEIRILQNIAQQAGKIVEVQLRLNPGIDVHAHSALQTAITDCKFGLGIDNGEALAAVKEIVAAKNLHLTGVHTHLGSTLFEMSAYLKALDRLTDFLVLASVVTGLTLNDVIVGGGFGVRYTDDQPLTLRPREIIETLAKALARHALAKGLPDLRLMIEPGRIITAEAGLTLYTVEAVKHIPGVRTYVSVDGGMTDNPRVALYGAKYEALLANRATEPATERVALAGRCCEQGDVLGFDYLLPTAKVGDTVAMFNTGAYHYAMASRYNRVPVPAVVLARFGKAALIVERESLEDIVKNDRMPSWFA